ncbi:hypothetical protein H8356DRAFT_943843 [Neocallimastix lanati (nom. inval.)]|uniref:Uncharacterized protein n=1 Tax=Neocallimastix californiae TaxID=1754190 RepID=A0A1Y2AVC3_9FUNG|nr:hypothetical protein H8356DRAFT_943843 [Neocallimastix sp. JGI-2020a]ORY26548.1 hypothetical protein LY90DRAFT_674563 [Neocallimastix californiae]|eukprot:ORY26548.1 hypothetical protein LY90DRAFT_674563 [Neocallimastix californiae]
MFLYAVTCLIWGDDPNNTFTILFSKKTNINDIKLKIMKHLNLNNDMIDKIKYYKVDEELYSNDKRFKILKDKDSFKLISPEQLFDITNVSDGSSLIVSFTDVESSFNNEDSIGAIIVLDEILNNMRNLNNRKTTSNIYSGKNAIIGNKDSFNSINEINKPFFQDDDDENYNGDYEDDFSEYDNKQSFYKSNIGKKEKIKKQTLKKKREEKENIKSRIESSKNYIDNSGKDNVYLSCKKQSNQCLNLNSIITSNNIPTPTEDLINIGEAVATNKYSPNRSNTITCDDSISPNAKPVLSNSGNSMEPILYTDSIPIQETIITEDESHLNPQTMDTSFYPRPSYVPKNNINQFRNKNISSTNEENSSTNNKRNENFTANTKTNNGYAHPRRIYYPESDIEVMEFDKNLKPSAPLENEVIEYNQNYIENNTSNNKTNINHNKSNLELSLKNTISPKVSGSSHKPVSNSSLNRHTRPPSISKSIIFGVEQFPTPPKPEDEVDITNVKSSQTQLKSTKNDDTVVHQYYSSEMNDLPPSYENINQQPSAPSISALNSNTSLLDNNNMNIGPPNSSAMEIQKPVRELINSDDYKKHSDCCSCGCYPCNAFKTCMMEKLNVPSKWAGLIKALCVLFLLIISGLIVFLVIYFSQGQSENHKLDYSIYTITKVTTTVSGTSTIAKTLIHRPLTIEEKGGPSQPTPRSITSNTNEVDDFIIESISKNTNEGLVRWTIKELTNPYLITSYFKPSHENSNNDIASASFQVSFDRIIEINDTININDSDSFYDLEVPKDKLNFGFFTNNGGNTDIDITKFSQFFEDEATKLNVTINYLFTSEPVVINEPKYAILNPQSARCLIEIENWNYKYKNSRFVIKSGITSTDLVWSVREENVINLNSSEGKIILNDSVDTTRNNNGTNATLKLYDDIVDFEDEGPVNVYYLIDNVKKSNYILADIEVLIRSKILDIMTTEYAQNVNAPVASSSTSRYSLLYLKFIQKIDLIYPLLIILILKFIP